jgi:hypothetical protein
MKLSKITGFAGSWQSGVATIYLDDEPVPCENAPTVRALASMFPNVISQGHSIDVSSIIGKEVLWVYDDMGLMLGGLALPEEVEA